MDTTALLSGDYLIKGIQTEKAIHGLKELYEYLGNHKQAEKPSDVKKLQRITQLLVKPHMLNATEEKIQLYLSCCLAEIIRIYAPNAPYKETQLKDIFELFLATLENIHTRKQSFYSNLLQQLVRVKAFLLLIDLDMQLVRDTFEQFLSIPVDDISKQDATNLQNILALCIQAMAEDDEILDDDILQTILVCFVPKFSKRGKATVPHQSFPLAANLILHCTAELQNSITQFILVAISRKGKGDTELYKHYHTLIRSINTISPSILVPVLPHLERELKSEDSKLRQRAIETLTIVLKESPSLFSTNRPLYDVFVSKHDDPVPDIRRHVVKACGTLLEYHPDSYPQISHMLGERIVDVDEHVRAESVSVICSAAERNLSLISSHLLEEAANRIIDTKPRVRMQTFFALSSLYNNVDPDDYDSDDYRSKINWIPKKIICCYHYTNWQVRYNVEKVVSEDLLPFAVEEDDEDDDLESIRAATLLDIALTFLDEPQVISAHQKLLKEKVTFQKLFAQFLEEHSSVGMFDEVDDTLFKKITTHFVECPKVAEYVANLNSLTKEVIQEFQVMLHNEEPLEKKIQAKHNALKNKNPYGTGKALTGEEREFYVALVEKINFTHITPCTVPKMFSHISSRLPKDSEEIPFEVEQLFSFMQGIAEIVPDYFSGCYLQLKAMLTDDNEYIVDNALSILSYTAHILSKQAFSNDILNELKTLCEKGTPKQAKCCIQSLAKIYAEDVNSFSKTFEELIEKLTVHLVGGSSKHYPTVMTSLGCIAEVAPEAFADSATLFSSFVLKTMFRPASAFDYKTRMNGIRAIVKYALTLESKQAKEEGRSIIEFLLEVISNHGSIQNEEIERSYLRKAAAVGLLELARKSHYEQMISPTQFLTLVTTTRDPCYEVRAKILDSLIKGCRIASLRTRYLAFMILFAGDPERAIVKKLKEGFTGCVKILRQIIKERIKQDPRIQLLNPEFALPFLLFVIAHAYDFEQDAPDYSLCGKYLLFFIEQIKTSNNMVFLFKCFDAMRKTKDAVNPKYSERMYVLCEIGKAIIKAKSPKKWVESNSAVFTPAMYQKIVDADELQSVLEKKYLPPTFRVTTLASKHYHNLNYPGEEVEAYKIDPESAIIPKSVGTIISPKKDKKSRKRRAPPKKAKKPPAKKRKLQKETPPARKSKRLSSQVSYNESSSEEEEEDSEENSADGLDGLLSSDSEE